MMAMAYGNVYVASVAMGAKDEHTLKAFLEAEAYDGPSIIIAYSHCIAHGIDMSAPLIQQKLAVDSGQWLLYRYNPVLAAQGGNPMTLDSKAPKLPVAEYLNTENRFKMLKVSHPEIAKEYFKQTQTFVEDRYKFYDYLANRRFSPEVQAEENK
jgi:pyruvate-ferredoxin/flavodoxin oxidoreductase